MAEHTSARQRDLFGPKPRRPRVHRMHVIDAGAGAVGLIARFQCSRCGDESDWLEIANVTEGKRGIPCPKCNGEEMLA